MPARLTVLIAANLVAFLDPEPKTWIQHKVRRHETLEDVAQAYGVLLEDVRRWNPDSPTSKLRIQARKFPQPRQRRRIRLHHGMTWESLALRFEVTVDELKRWNPSALNHASLSRAGRLTVYVPSGLRQYPLPPLDTPLPSIETPEGGLSVGRPHQGRLLNGIKLPESSDYAIRSSYQAYGSSLTIDALTEAIAGFRRDTGFKGPLFVGALSRRTGRRLRPHASHQSGRDADLRLPAMSFAPESGPLEAYEVDWFATWALLESLIRTQRVEVIFLERRLFRRLREAAERLGTSPARIDQVMAFVRHSKGHLSHLHVRFVCSPTSPKCKGPRLRKPLVAVADATKSTID